MVNIFRFRNIYLRLVIQTASVHEVCNKAVISPDPLKSASQDCLFPKAISVQLMAI